MGRGGQVDRVLYMRLEKKYCIVETQNFVSLHNGCPVEALRCRDVEFSFSCIMRSCKYHVKIRPNHGACLKLELNSWLFVFLDRVCDVCMITGRGYGNKNISGRCIHRQTF
jgi:hypothetical protein